MILLAPGPVPVPQTVLKAMSENVVHHRTPQFEHILREAWAGLQWVFRTTQPVQILSGTGTAAMEAAVVNLLSPGEEALVVVSGKFGERWAEIGERYGVKVHRWNLEWGAPADNEKFAQELKRLPNLRLVFTQVCETSTATVHPVQAMARAVREHSKALFAVDAITAVGCMELPMDAWGLDVVVAGSQKAFMIPTGLSFIALSARAWEAAGKAKINKFYLDLSAEKKANARGETHFSTPTSLVMGLTHVLRRMQEAGLEHVIARCNLLAGVTRFGGERTGLQVFSQSPSASVTALRTPAKVNSAELRDRLEKERGITIMGGQDQLKGKILRVGHMGDVRNSDMIALFEALAAELRVPFDFKPELEARLQTVAPLFP